MSGTVLPCQKVHREDSPFTDGSRIHESLQSSQESQRGDSPQDVKEARTVSTAMRLTSRERSEAGTL